MYFLSNAGGNSPQQHWVETMIDIDMNIDWSNQTIHLYCAY